MVTSSGRMGSILDNTISFSVSKETVAFVVSVFIQNSPELWQSIMITKQERSEDFFVLTVTVESSDVTEIINYLLELGVT